MQVHRDLEHLPSFDKAVITIGTFDGVHCGHQKIIRQVKEEAEKCGGESVLVTFDPHPRKILNPDPKNLKLLNTLDEKIFLLNKQGIDHLIIVPFTKAFSELSATEYVRDFLVEKIHPHIIIIGYDHHFGHNREGNIHLLQRLENQYMFRVIEIPAEVIHDMNVSSTKIRDYLRNGKIELANELLGYAYFISGKVIHGDQRGRDLGFPTANIAPGSSHKLIPANGIYSSKVHIPSSVHGKEKSAEVTYEGAANIGHAPTFGGTEERVEVYIFQFDKALYNETIMLCFYHFIRQDKKFPTADALVLQMKEDVKKIKKVLNHPD